MIINITQHCTLKCAHCMQCAGPDRKERMDGKTFMKTLEFAENIGSRILLISGGEPTTHPEFLGFLREAINKDMHIAVLSNGSFLRDHSFTEEFAELVKYNPELTIQITSIKGLYDNYKEVHKPNLKGLRLFGKNVVLCDETNTKIQMKPLGRACSGEWYEEAKKVNGFPPCSNASLIMAQCEKTARIGELLENLGRYCSPMVSWDGSIRTGESEQCKVVANISEPLEKIIDKLYQFRPCGGCDSYKWHFQNPSTFQEKQVCKVLWPCQADKEIKL